MTPLMMSALTSHTTLKHNYYYTTQHLHCDITDISTLHATLMLVHFRLDGAQCGGGRYSCRGCHRCYGLTTVTTANKGQ